MLSVKTIPVGDLTANCYLVSDSNECLIIDPGDDADFITETINQEKLKPVAIVLTHGHFDHVLGCLELKLNFDIPILLHERDKKIYTSANQSAKHWLKKNTLRVPPIDQFIKEGDKIKVGTETLTVIETPGHTPGSICLFGNKVLFSGDTIFKDAVGRTDLSYSSPSDLSKSLQKLKSLTKLKSVILNLFQDRSRKNFGMTPTIIVYPGHGESTTLAAFFTQHLIG